MSQARPWGPRDYEHPLIYTNEHVPKLRTCMYDYMQTKGDLNCVQTKVRPNSLALPPLMS